MFQNHNSVVFVQSPNPLNIEFIWGLLSGTRATRAAPRTGLRLTRMMGCKRNARAGRAGAVRARPPCPPPQPSLRGGRAVPCRASRGGGGEGRPLRREAERQRLPALFAARRLHGRGRALAAAAAATAAARRRRAGRGRAVVPRSLRYVLRVGQVSGEGVAGGNEGIAAIVIGAAAPLFVQAPRGAEGPRARGGL